MATEDADNLATEDAIWIPTEESLPAEAAEMAAEEAAASETARIAEAKDPPDKTAIIEENIQNLDKTAIVLSSTNYGENDNQMVIAHLTGFQCEECEIFCSSKRELNEHYKDVHGGRKF